MSEYQIIKNFVDAVKGYHEETGIPKIEVTEDATPALKAWHDAWWAAVDYLEGKEKKPKDAGVIKANETVMSLKG
jgi:hypothetical protein